jgi:hypothetical protein
MTESHRHLDFVDTVRRSKPSSTGYRDAVELEWRGDDPTGSARRDKP